MSEMPAPNRRPAWIATAVTVAILIPLGYGLVAPLFAHPVESADVFLERPDPQYQSCVRETEYMRYHHWELLRQIREEVVRYGIRGDVGLKTCRECHTSRERFCTQCHNAVSLSPDCYGCHYYP